MLPVTDSLSTCLQSGRHLSTLPCPYRVSQGRSQGPSHAHSPVVS